MLPVTFPYNKKAPINTLLWLTAVLIGVTYGITVNSHGGGKIMWIIIGFCDGLTLCVMFYIYVKQLKPALRREVALEFNSLDLIFIPKNLTISWKIIHDIELKVDGNGRYLYVTAIGPADIKLHARIDLDCVAGNADDIYKTTMDYFKEAAKHA
jgi:hypothetical protein